MVNGICRKKSPGTCAPCFCPDNAHLDPICKEEEAIVSKEPEYTRLQREHDIGLEEVSKPIPSYLEPNSMRSFASGATRDTDARKLDFEAALSPEVIECFVKYMNFHRDTPIGLRDSDNWQKGFPLSVLMKSLWRHFFALWKYHRHPRGNIEHPLASACGVLFNLQCYMKQIIESDPELVSGMITYLMMEKMKRESSHG